MNETRMSDFGIRPTTGSLGTTYWLDEEGRRTYPCRCGETHSGDYAAHDFAHHNCFHRAPLVALIPRLGFYACPDCGESFYLKHDADECPECGGRYRKMTPDGDGPAATYECANGHSWRGPATPFGPAKPQQTEPSEAGPKPSRPDTKQGDPREATR